MLFICNLSSSPSSVRVSCHQHDQHASIHTFSLVPFVRRRLGTDIEALAAVHIEIVYNTRNAVTEPTPMLTISYLPLPSTILLYVLRLSSTHPLPSLSYSRLSF